MSFLEQPFVPIGKLIRMHGQERPMHTAIICGDTAIDWGAFDRRTAQVAAALKRDGVTRGQAVAICAAMSIDYVCLFFGAIRAGVIVAPLSPSLSAPALHSMIGDADAELLFTDATTAQAMGDTPARATIIFPLDPWLADIAGHSDDDAVQPGDGCNLLYSSGTTGTPKGVMQPHSMRWAHVRRGSIQGYDRESITLVSTPLYSNTTLVSVYPTIGLGGTLVLMPKFDAAGFLALSVRHRVTNAMLVPVQYQRIMALPDFDAFDLSTYRMKYSTSAPLPAPIKADILARWPGGLIESYGMTEGGGLCILKAHEHPDKLDTVGQPAPGSDMRLIDDAGHQLPVGGVGEIVGRSPAMMTGYHKRPDETAQAEWHDPAGLRFIRTGDIGCFDADGFLKLIDRKKDMILSGGFNLYPSDMERVIAEHPLVGDVAVVGVPSAEWGETPVAFVVLRAGESADPSDIRAWANTRLERLQKLADLRVVESLPRNSIGKVVKRSLRDGYQAAPGGSVA